MLRSLLLRSTESLFHLVEYTQKIVNFQSILMRIEPFREKFIQIKAKLAEFLYHIANMFRN